MQDNGDCFSTLRLATQFLLYCDCLLTATFCEIVPTIAPQTSTDGYSMEFIVNLEKNKLSEERGSDDWQGEV